MTSPELHVVVAGPLEQRTGGYIYDARIVAGLRRLAWQVIVHSLDGQFPDADALARQSLERTLRDLPDGARVVVDGLAMGGLPAPVRANRERLRILALVHHPLSEETGLAPPVRARFAASEREALAGCRGVLVTSEFTASRLESFGIPAERVRAVLPGVDRVPPARGPIADEPPMLLCVASVIPRKGHDVLVRALARLRDARWTCVCAGSVTRAPAFASAVTVQTREVGLTDRIQFLGECESDALDGWYDASSVFVLASHYEGYGMALTEALARGLPVVSTTAGAIPDAVPPDAGVLVPPGNDAALAEALAPLLSDGGSERRAVSAAARRYAESLPTWAQTVAAFAAATLELTPERTAA